MKFIGIGSILINIITYYLLNEQKITITNSYFNIANNNGGYMNESYKTIIKSYTKNLLAICIILLLFCAVLDLFWMYLIFFNTVALFTSEHFSFSMYEFAGLSLLIVIAISLTIYTIIWLKTYLAIKSDVRNKRIEKCKVKIFKIIFSTTGNEKKLPPGTNIPPFNGSFPEGNTKEGIKYELITDKGIMFKGITKCPNYIKSLINKKATITYLEYSKLILDFDII